MVNADATIRQLRDAEFARLDRNLQVYLDYTGTGLYADSQLREHAELLREGVFGNPHSVNPTSRTASKLVDRARDAVLRFFDADPAEYAVIFSQNATGALRLVGEAYPFVHGSRLVLTSDNHNSVNGLRAYACARGGTVQYLPLDVDLRLPADSASNVAPASAPSLFAYPLQSNFSGVRHDVQWVRTMQDRGYHVLVDAAAFVPTNPLSLRIVKPDFLCLSFYKMFGYPTGIGALIAKREALSVLRRPWFSGGTVEWVSVQNVRHQLEAAPAAFEDGTVNFLGISAVPIGLSFLSRVGVERIREHVAGLTRRLLEGVRSLSHADGRPMVVIHGPADCHGRGGTVAFNVVSRFGRVVPFIDVERAAGEQNISIRGGCFCNPGAAEFAFGYDARRAATCLDRTSPGVFDAREFAACLGTTVGAVRASAGLPTTTDDIDRLLEFLGRTAASYRLPAASSSFTASR